MVVVVRGVVVVVGVVVEGVVVVGVVVIAGDGSVADDRCVVLNLLISPLPI